MGKFYLHELIGIQAISGKEDLAKLNGITSLFNCQFFYVKDKNSSFFFLFSQESGIPGI
jgi:ribosomal 30S subunit maturation factor RimM